jgi:hypothetical protein
MLTIDTLFGSLLIDNPASMLFTPASSFFALRPTLLGSGFFGFVLKSVLLLRFCPFLFTKAVAFNSGLVLFNSESDT